MLLPFGLSTAHYILTKVLQPVVKQVRGIRIVLYLDDGMVVVKDSENMAVAISVQVQQILIASGLIVNSEKYRLLTEVEVSMGFINRATQLRV